MSDAIDTLRYRGKPIERMTVDELRAALVETMRYARELWELHDAHITMLRNFAQRDADLQQRLFMEHAQ